MHRCAADVKRTDLLRFAARSADRTATTTELADLTRAWLCQHFDLRLLQGHAKGAVQQLKVQLPGLQAGVASALTCLAAVPRVAAGNTQLHTVRACLAVVDFYIQSHGTTQGDQYYYKPLNAKTPYYWVVVRSCHRAR